MVWLKNAFFFLVTTIWDGDAPGVTHTVVVRSADLLPLITNVQC